MPSPIHAVLVIITGWHNQPHFTLLPTPRPQASFPSPIHYYLARHWCSGARNAMNLVFRKSKIREKTDLGAWGRRQAQPGDWGRLSGCFSQIREIKGGMKERERVGEGSDSTCLVSLYNRSRSYPTTFTPTPFWWHHWIIMILSITPSSSATTSVSLEVKWLYFNSVLWYFTCFSCLLDFLLRKELDLPI